MSRLAIRWARDLEPVGPADRPEGQPLGTLLVAGARSAPGRPRGTPPKAARARAMWPPSAMNEPSTRDRRHGRTPCA